ncbi:tyrosine-type recombinase/integrase [Mesorhizobium sp. ASY16-5R]|uniref:tyrosine-type recombinase/integrase n=1 Tax=Mesorhizobium sp. ASY16-5R TaxID=3445772 RepID=UPI003F9FB061
MAIELTDALIKQLPLPSKGMAITYDAEVKGFGIRVTAKGAKSFILNYRTKIGAERRITIGSVAEWKTTVAREQAKKLKREIDVGGDPLGEREEERKAEAAAKLNAKTVADMCDRFLTDYLPSKRPPTIRDYTAMINNEIRPELGSTMIVALERKQVKKLHEKITKTGKKVKANRVVAVLSKMLSEAVHQWEWPFPRQEVNGIWVQHDPTKHIQKNSETNVERYLDDDELARLWSALDAYPIRTRKDGGTYVDARALQSANVIRLLMLTGARSGELLGTSLIANGKRYDKEGVRWEQFDLKKGVWTKPASTTKQNKKHVVNLSSHAIELLTSIRADAENRESGAGDYVFPGQAGSAYLTEIKKAWAEILKAAEITNFRIHDLRHTYASVLVSEGHSLPIIGKLLGHANSATTERYAHINTKSLRKAGESAGAILSGKPSADPTTGSA